MTGDAYLCPLPGCDWFGSIPTREVPENALASVFGPGMVAQVAVVGHARALEDMLRAHFESHSLEDWVRGIREVVKERDALWHAALRAMFNRDLADGIARSVQLTAATAEIARLEAARGGGEDGAPPGA